MDVVEEEGSNPNKIYIYCSSIIFDLQIFDPLEINHKSDSVPRFWYQNTRNNRFAQKKWMKLRAMNVVLVHC